LWRLQPARGTCGEAREEDDVDEEEGDDVTSEDLVENTERRYEV
jgi:hypothetical protein